VSEGIALVRSARARRLRLRVDPATGAVTLTLPKRASAREAMAWAEANRGWIDAERAKLPQARPFVPGGMVLVEGVDHVIEWDAGRGRGISVLPELVSGRGTAGQSPVVEGQPHASPALRAAPPPSLRDCPPPRASSGRTLLIGGPAETLSRRLHAWLRRHALATLSADTAHYAALAGVSVARVAVGDARSRWGSCAGSGVIRYSWRLILVPAWVRHATVAHEVAHRIEMNHSPAFHAAHRALLGADPAPARAWLRAHGAALHWVGRESS